MNRIVLCVVTLVACGGGKKQVEEPPAAAAMVKPESEPKPEVSAPPAEPAVARNHGAKAALEPVKGAKQPPGTVTFTQSNDATSVVSDFQGLKAGKYHLVIHDSNECGPNATKVGAPWKGAEGVKLSFSVGGDNLGNLDEANVALKLDGVAPITGQTLVLYDDKKGQPGKALACGTIDAVGAAE
jgi:hypothetical protein